MGFCYKMLNIEITDYDISMVEQIRRLFTDIYPNEPDIVDKLCYDPERRDHISTKIACLNRETIGQANIFFHKLLNGNANLGFHVHPSKQGHGIATTLSNEALKEACAKGIRLFFIVTETENYAAIAVARKLGFIEVENTYAEKNLLIFKKQR